MNWVISHDEFVLGNNALNLNLNFKDLISLSKILVFYKAMLSYCLKCIKNTENKNEQLVKTKNESIMLLSKCAVCNNKKSKFIKEQEPRGLLSSLRIMTHLKKIPLVGALLF